MSPKTGHITISSGQSQSSPLKVISETLVGIYMPAVWTAADLGFSASPDGTAYYPVQDIGAPLTVTAGAGQYIPLDFTKFVGIAYLKVTSTAGGSPVNQAAERVLTPVFRALN